MAVPAVMMAKIAAREEEHDANITAIMLMMSGVMVFLHLP
jgi:hypothetical protein